MADVLIFETVEFEVLETFDFEEEIRRPEDTRFFTLEEQLTDYLEKMMPVKKATKFELQQLKYTRDRIKEIYSKLITVTDTDYIVNTNRKKINVSWVHPVYAEFEYKSYSYNAEWMPFFEQTRRRTPNYYPQLLAALPRPYVTTSEGRSLTSAETLVNSEGLNPINTLGNFIATKTLINDDNTLDVVTVAIANTNDDIKSTGFYLDARPYELPRPMMEHPFLKSTQPAYIETSNSLFDIYPSISTILEHAIPVSTDPYAEQSKTLKLYDIRLSQIPWAAWKERFPPVDLKNTPNTLTELSFKSETEKVPGDVLIKQYSKWNPGLNSRKWLSLQIDAGVFVAKLLLSDSSTAGLLPTPPVEIAPALFPEANPEICVNLTSNFDMFLSSGLYRPSVEKETGLKCVSVPIGSIQQEKRDAGFKGRIGWKETTKHDILVEYQKLLKEFRVSKIEESIGYTVVARLIKSERSKDVVSIMNDPARAPEDKADAIELIVRDLNLENKKYLDVLGQFVVCSHTLAILHGKMEDRFAFYSEWTATQEGIRVCKYCGEEVNKDTFVAVKEYDEDGHVTMDYETLTEKTFHGEDPFVNSLSKLRNIFDFNNAGELLLFTILSFLQILPTEEQTLAILQLIRKLTVGLKSRAAASKSISKEKQDLVEGILGIAGSVVLLQAHVPFLIPKRSIGNRPLNTSGFPRDSSDLNECNTLDSILIVLRRTFESFPATYKGSTATVLRSILRNSKELKDQALQWIKIFADQFKTLFENARERYTAPAVEAPKNLIQLPLEKVDNPVYSPDEQLEEEQQMMCTVPRTSVSWNTKRIPSVRQKEIILHSKINPSPVHTLLTPIHSNLKFIQISEKDTRERVSRGLPTGFTALSEFVKNADAAAFVMLASRFLTLLANTTFSIKIQQNIQTQLSTLNTQVSSSLARDVAKGIFFEMMHAIKGSPPANRAILSAIKLDLTTRMMLMTNEAAEREDFELRAKERNALKATLRSMNDTQREITQRLLELGIADFIITNKDRENFLREFGKTEDVIEEPIFDDPNRPEEGYDDDRDYVENGDQPIADDGNLMEVDRGNYGDRAVRDYDDYTSQQVFDEEG